MPTPTKGPRLGAGPSHERLMLAGLATALFEHGKITTTVAKARRLRPLAERMITFAKRGDLHARRRVLTVVRDKSVVHTLFTEIGPRFAARSGGYTRIVKVGPRHGDNAPMAIIELVEGTTLAQQAVDEGERARGSRFRRDRKASAPAAATPAVSTPTAGASTVAEAVPAAGDRAGAPHDGAPQVAMPTEGGDTEVVTEQVPTDPAPTDSAPTDPAPTDPAPTDTGDNGPRDTA